MITTQIKGIKKLHQSLKAESKRQKKALEIAIRVEAFKRMRQLRDQIKKGIPGNHPYKSQLSEIARRTKTGREKKNQIPLYKLSRLIRYQVEYKFGRPVFSFGFVSGRAGRLSSSWKKLLLAHEEGTDVLYTGSRTELGRRFARIGGRLKKKGDPDARFFFLRRMTGRRIGIPQRAMIDPFWDAYGDDMWHNIRNDYRRKLKGERI